ncbi:MAG: helix-turn-helix transcriptional regulator [Labilithrix sp.]|nr:helix-turn-helix transcriptional regulator [Labilithrix sp.]
MATDGALLDCLAASYRLDLSGTEYVRHLVEAAAPLLDRGLGVIAYTYDARDRERPTIDHFATSKRFDPSWLPRFYAALVAAGHDGPPSPTGFHAWRHLPCGQASTLPKMRPLLPCFAQMGGSRDTFAVNALDASGQGLWIGAPLPSTVKVPDARVALFTRFAAHLTSALRLRRSAAGGKPLPAAVLSPNGTLLDAASGEDVIEVREELRRATVAFEQARTKKMRSDVDLATKRWRPLVVSRWSLLDDFDSDGRRFVVAVENASPTRPPRTDLSEREHQVMTQAHLGHTDKVIAYELGLSTSTVRVLLHRATRKLGASTRREALARFDALTKEHADKKKPDG